eukprot:CAMPEP_0185576474 /NCGR_PEP_ID=MMETSP0434-20130131/7396_1 /TAXON_ID=626734 ORGANISM="Favella taraikaensis, Strain Fe Narragansett Bay" /NCGR_SAMPLE_ID=MMETSP0434 /ASSEMBLY_ACC=CAM_ASM_000379 /LENGTH=198 /DNA_ID=CAMNT_0028193701 /DNA_START=1950 /DNA_END=2546 /DNA_ORIENTATION=-
MEFKLAVHFGNVGGFVRHKCHHLPQEVPVRDSLVELALGLLLLVHKDAIGHFQARQQHDHLSVQVGYRVGGAADDAQVEVVAIEFAHRRAHLDQAFHITGLQHEHALVASDTNLVSGAVLQAEVLVNLRGQIFMNVARAIREGDIRVVALNVFHLKDRVLLVAILVNALEVAHRIVLLRQFPDRFGARETLADPRPIF